MCGGSLGGRMRATGCPARRAGVASHACRPRLSQTVTGCSAPTAAPRAPRACVCSRLRSRRLARRADRSGAFSCAPRRGSRQRSRTCPCRASPSGTLPCPSLSARGLSCLGIRGPGFLSLPSARRAACPVHAGPEQTVQALLGDTKERPAVEEPAVLLDGHTLMVNRLICKRHAPPPWTSAPP